MCILNRKYPSRFAMTMKSVCARIRIFLSGRKENGAASSVGDGK